MLLHMISHEFRSTERFSGLRTGFTSVRTSISESRFVHALRNAAAFVHSRWLAFCFTRRFYAQACRADVAVTSTEPIAANHDADMTECLIHRSVPEKLHALVLLRVVSQIASVPQTTLRAEACRSHGWSDDQIKAAMIRNIEQTFTPSEALALRYADDLTRTPIDVDPLTIRALRNHFSESELSELTASIAYENFRCRFKDASSRLR
jgi:alkylhydroperoxidase family enzyme